MTTTEQTSKQKLNEKLKSLLKGLVEPNPGCFFPSLFFQFAFIWATLLMELLLNPLLELSQGDAERI